MRRLGILALLLLWFAPACAGPAGQVQANPAMTAGKILLATQNGIVTAATAMDAMCRTPGLVDIYGDCARAKELYEQSKPAYDAAADALIAALSTPESADAWTKWQVADAELNRIAALLFQIQTETGGGR